MLAVSCAPAENRISKQAYAASPEWTISPSFGHMHDISAAASGYYQRALSKQCEALRCINAVN